MVRPLYFFADLIAGLIFFFFIYLLYCTAGFWHFLSHTFSPCTSVFCCPLHNFITIVLILTFCNFLLLQSNSSCRKTFKCVLSSIHLNFNIVLVSFICANSYSLLILSIKLIFFILLQIHISKAHTLYFCAAELEKKIM